MYEVLLTTPPHDIKEHISNVVTEIVAHIPDDDKILCEKTLELVAGTNKQLRGSDYREISMVLAKQLRGYKEKDTCNFKMSTSYMNLSFINPNFH